MKLENALIDTGSAKSILNIDAIIGMDFLQETGPIIDLNVLCIRTKNI